VLGEAAVAAGRTDTFLGKRYRRIARRRAKRAIVAVGRSILVIVWHLLADPTARFHDLGAGFYDTRINPKTLFRSLWLGEHPQPADRQGSHTQWQVCCRILAGPEGSARRGDNVDRGWWV
jgi:hypothetical protein